MNEERGYYMSKALFLKIVSAILALLMVSVLFVACGKDAPEEGGQTEPKEEKKENTDPVPHYDWGGREFKVMTVANENEPNIEVVGEVTGDTVSQAVYRRNTEIEDYYKVKILTEQFNGSNEQKAQEDMLRWSQGDDNPYDLVFLVRNAMAATVQNGFLYDLNELKYIDTTHDWYNQSTLATMAIGGRLFHGVSDFSLVDKARTNVLYFNRDLAADKQYPDVIQMVRDEEWTVEEMAKLCKYQDNGDEIRGINDDWGVVLGGKETVIAFWNGCDNKIISIDNEGKWEITVATERSIDSVDKLLKIIGDDVSFRGDQLGSYDDAFDCFVGGHALFMSGCLSSVASLGRDANFAYTAIPYAKFDKEQEHYYTTNNNTYTATFGIPKFAYDPDFSAFMVEVLSWKSSDTSLPAYIEQSCKVQNSYDPICAEMITLTLDGVIFDFGLIYSSNIKLVGKVIQAALIPANADAKLAALYEAQRDTATAQAEELFNQIALID